jgi:NTE family protein
VSATDKGITLVLGGVGAKGAASVGVLQSIYEHKIEVKRIIASGISSIASIQFALGREPKALTKYVVRFFEVYQRKLWGLAQLEGFRERATSRALTDFSYFIRGVSFCQDNYSKISPLSWEAIQADLKEVFGDAKASDLKLPVAISVIDLTLNEELLIENEGLMESIKAGIAFPGLFSPVTIGGHDMISSTLYCELPLTRIKENWRPIVVVDVPNVREAAPPISAIEVLAEIDQMRRAAIKTKLLSKADRVLCLKEIEYLREDYGQIPRLVSLAYSNTNRLLESQ